MKLLRFVRPEFAIQSFGERLRTCGPHEIWNICH